MKVIGIGDNVCDKYIHLKTMFPGGQTLNFAAYAGVLGADAAYYFNPFEYDKKNARITQTSGKRDRSLFPE